MLFYSLDADLHFHRNVCIIRFCVLLLLFFFFDFSVEKFALCLSQRINLLLWEQIHNVTLDGKVCTEPNELRG